jgi:predicted membrane channel-forming protein YqfA (hemolysin III family)
MYHLASVHTILARAVDIRYMLMQVGAILYACRFPERMFPGKFDLAFSSHQLFHVCVVVAAAIHYKAIFQLLAWRDATGGAGGCLKGSCQTVLPLMQLTTG